MEVAILNSTYWRKTGAGFKHLKVPESTHGIRVSFFQIWTGKGEKNGPRYYIFVEHNI